MMDWGIPWGGAADPLSMKIANLLLDNSPNNPVLEATLLGPRIEFQCDITIAIAGAQFTTMLNDSPIENYKTVKIKSGDILDIGRVISGARTYIAFPAKIEIPQILGSAGTHIVSKFGGLNDDAIRTGDTIDLINIRPVRELALNKNFHLIYTNQSQIRIVPGSESDLFPETLTAQFYKTTFEVSPQSNRMGIRLSGLKHQQEKEYEAKKVPMISSGLYPGSIQVPPDEKPIISFIEGQTIGGYPRIGHVIKAELHRLGQLKPSDKIRFQKINLGEAKSILKKKRELLHQLQLSLGKHEKEFLIL
ncbi:biotin-dependent carboxyltransferase family protein [Microbulbifer sp. OS29]|uniref:Biotin-dependent carboxyltransferase family protein n=2 Tax=Microbulbifer okhotskensis TaxID=2926617 RepID=A0A9X2J7A3_9GAMM|nr:biotin-dependent carboxyltransferase family protein [Microbulbifer okhotskensis]